ncbi:MAG: glutamine--scyllo-inositol aminotransferase, partial [Spirochaetaceae bacterium]
MSALAIDGGTPVRSAPFPLRRLMGPDEQAAVNAMFDRARTEGHGVFGYNGPEEQAYCSDFASSLGGGYADAVNSGSNAVWVALRSLELEPLGEVIVPAVSDPGGVMPVAIANQLPVP